jgi:hypothetical protein
MDTFNQFWKDLEGMLDNLSQPVAFATAPLARFGGPESIREPNDRLSRRKASDDSTLQTVPGTSGHVHKHGLALPAQRQSGSPPQVHVDPTILCKAKTNSDDLEEVMADEGRHCVISCCLWYGH